MPFRLHSLLTVAFSVLLTGWTAPLGAAEMATIELTDGSTVRGEVLSLSQNAYEIKSPSLGTLSIPQERVVIVRYGNESAVDSTALNAAATAQSAAPAQDNGALNGLVTQLMGQLSQDPQALKEIAALGQDPALRTLLEDPAVRAAISSQDYASLADNPKVRALMNHPTIRRLSQRVSPGSR